MIAGLQRIYNEALIGNFKSYVEAEECDQKVFRDELWDIIYNYNRRFVIAVSTMREDIKNVAILKDFCVVMFRKEIDDETLYTALILVNKSIKDGFIQSYNESSDEDKRVYEEFMERLCI